MSKPVTIGALVGLASWFTYQLYMTYKDKNNDCCDEGKVSEYDSNSNDNINENNENEIILLSKYPTKGHVITPDDVLKFWFGDIKTPNDNISDKIINNWYNPNKSFDNLIKKLFGDFMISVLIHNKYNDWNNSYKGCLALIIITNQFTKNVYRNNKNMFKYDKLSEKICLNGINKKFDIKLINEYHPITSIFYYNPLSLSENIQLQNLRIDKQKYIINNIINNNIYKNINIKNHLKKISKSININYNIITQCGRFPQRNNILNRKTTKNEYKIMNKYNIKNDHNIQYIFNYPINNIINNNNSNDSDVEYEPGSPEFNARQARQLIDHQPN